MSIIAGAGPAGLTAAITLARADREVVVYEQHPDVGWRFSDGYQILVNYSEEESVPEMLDRMGLEANFTFIPKSDIEFYDHRNVYYAMKGSKPFGYFITRGPGKNTLDQGLKAQAIAAGVKFRFGERAPDHAHIRATGGHRVQGVSMERVVKTDAEDKLVVLLDDNIAPGGFAYVFVLEGRATIAVAVTEQIASIRSFLETAIRRLMELVPLDLSEAQTHTSSMDFFLSQTAETPSGQLLAGEAAGFQDFLFGLGIRTAMETGYLAARSIISGTDYDSAWKARFQKNFQASLVNRFFFEIGGNLSYRAFMWTASHTDFYKLGRKLSTPSLFHRVMTPLVRLAWRNRRPSPIHRAEGHRPVINRSPTPGRDAI